MLSRKNSLGKTLNRMRQVYPEDYSFYPRTWVLPTESSELKTFNYSQHNRVYIVKPEASSQGNGIYLTMNVDRFGVEDRFVVQEYIKRPLLIEGLKFDLRLYVLLAGCDPLRVYLHSEGLVRLATQPYTRPKASNLHRKFIHLTNYAINKESDRFIYNEDFDSDFVGHKRSLQATLMFLRNEGCDVAQLWQEIQVIVAKTICSIQPSISHTYRACQPSDPYNGMCFEILGFDVLLDRDLRPWLLEVNHTPSFNTDSPLDEKVKTQVISDALTLLNIDSSHRTLYEQNKIRGIRNRAFPMNRTQEREKKKLLWLSAQLERDEWENSHLGGYCKVLPCENSQKYNQFTATANNIWGEWTGSKKHTVTAKGNPSLSKRADPTNNPGSSLISSMQFKPIHTEEKKLTHYSKQSLERPLLGSTAKGLSSRTMNLHKKLAESAKIPHKELVRSSPNKKSQSIFPTLESNGNRKPTTTKRRVS